MIKRRVSLEDEELARATRAVSLGKKAIKNNAETRRKLAKARESMKMLDEYRLEFDKELGNIEQASTVAEIDFQRIMARYSQLLAFTSAILKEHHAVAKAIISKLRD